MTEGTRHVDLVEYLVGEISPAQGEVVETHLAGCAECREEVDSVREMRTMLDEIPPEMALDGPPEGGDLMLRRALRQVQAESTRSRRADKATIAVAAAVAVAAVLGAGFFVGQATGGDDRPVAEQQADPQAPPLTPGSTVVSATDPDTGARLSASVVPKEGWVQVNAAVTGIAAGERCRLYVVGRDGSREIAVSWVVSDKGGTLSGTALIEPAEVTSLEVENVDGDRFVAAAV